MSSFVGQVAVAAPAAKAGRQPAPAPEARELLAAETDGLIEVKLVQNDSRSAQIVVANKADRPLTLKMPAAFAGVPVLAQGGMMNQGGIGPGGNMAGFGAAGQPQTTGGGVNQAGMGIGGGPGNGGGMFCWVAREVYGAHDPRWVRFRGWMRFEGDQLVGNPLRGLRAAVLETDRRDADGPRLARHHDEPGRDVGEPQLPRGLLLLGVEVSDGNIHDLPQGPLRHGLVMQPRGHVLAMGDVHAEQPLGRLESHPAAEPHPARS